MKVGKYLLEKHGFDKDSTKARFLEDFGYSENVLDAILNDRYPVLLGCHLHDLAIFTGEDVDFLHSLEEFDKLTELEKVTLSSPPPGKPFVTRPILGKVVIKDPKTGEWEHEKEAIPVIKLNLNSDDPVELGEACPDPEMEALFARARELSKGKTFRIITPKAVEVGDELKKDPSEADYVVTTYPIKGPQSVKIVKGRELGIGTGDKFVVADKMRSTLDCLGIDTEPKEVEVKIGNQRIAALMEDPEFRKEWQDVVAEQLVALAKQKLGEGFELELPQRQTGCRGKDLIALYYKDNPTPDAFEESAVEKKDLYALSQEPGFRTMIGANEPIGNHVMVPIALLRELANIAIDNGYPCAEEAFQYLTKNK